jgi:hypothetical protein
MGPLLPSDPDRYDLNTVTQVIVTAVNIALMIAGGIAVIYVIIGAYYYLTAYGDEEKVSTGKKTITWAIIGIVVIFSGELIVRAIWHFASGTNPIFPF